MRIASHNQISEEIATNRKEITLRHKMKKTVTVLKIGRIGKKMRVPSRLVEETILLESVIKTTILVSKSR